jgi:hypothetical protein
MNRFRTGAITALAVISLAVVGCQNQGADTESIEGVLESMVPSMDMTMPSGSDDMDASTEPSPSDS